MTSNTQFERYLIKESCQPQQPLQIALRPIGQELPVKRQLGDRSESLHIPWICVHQHTTYLGIAHYKFIFDKDFATLLYYVLSRR